jgi:hypothetical protein
METIQKITTLDCFAVLAMTNPNPHPSPFDKLRTALSRKRERENCAKRDA